MCDKKYVFIKRHYTKLTTRKPYGQNKSHKKLLLLTKNIKRARRTHIDTCLLNGLGVKILVSGSTIIASIPR